MSEVIVFRLSSRGGNISLPRRWAWPCVSPMLVIFIWTKCFVSLLFYLCYIGQYQPDLLWNVNVYWYPYTFTLTFKVKFKKVNTRWNTFLKSVILIIIESYFLVIFFNCLSFIFIGFIYLLCFVILQETV